MDVAVDKRLPEVDPDMEDTMNAQLKPRSQHQNSDVVPHVSKVDNGDEKSSENNTYSDDIKGRLEDLDMHEILNVVLNNAKDKEEREIMNAIKERTSKSTQQVKEEFVEEEVFEIELEEAIPKLNTHTIHCLNCDRKITKVILRRKIDSPRKPLDLLDRFSCFPFYTSSGNGQDSFAPVDENVYRDEGNFFSIFRVFGNRPRCDADQPEPLSTTGDIKYTTGKLPISGTSVGGTYDTIDQLPTSHPGEQPGKDETSIDIPPQTSAALPAGQPQRAVGQDSTSFEIFKSVVYGGLMEVIASLSVVASAAAGDASTRSIIALVLANLIGGIIVVAHNLWDLRDDYFKYSSQQTSDQEARNKYKELLGRVEHFPMHLFFVVLSFLVFGIIPPLAYGYSFHETNDKDFTMAVVAIASLVGVGLLAIFKSYIDRCTGFSGYFKTISYYLTTAVAVSGVSYVAGNLAKRLIEKLGLFGMGSGVAMGLLPEVVSANPSLAYY